MARENRTGMARETDGHPMSRRSLVTAAKLSYAGKDSRTDHPVELTPQHTTETRRLGIRTWQSVRPELASKLSDARLQLHYAAQFATAAGISFLPPEPDDSHSNLEWLPEYAGLFSRLIPAKKPFRVGVRFAELALLVVPEPRTTIAESRLNRCTIAETTDWLRSQIESQGADPERYTLRRHYEIPYHPLASGSAFDTSERAQFEEMSKWFSNGAVILSDLVRSTSGASEVRCWPHHFDISTLIELSPDRAIGVGLEPGDTDYSEPYFYVNMSPKPTAAEVRSRPLAGNGTWHTNGWIGAILPGSRLGAPATQEPQVREFLKSATSIAREVVGQN